MVTEVRIRAFRAVDEPETCRHFIEGHRTVLGNHGINKVTSSNDQWANWPSVFVVVVESEDDGRMFGGARVHAADGVHPLPIEGAVGDMDPSIYVMVRENLSKGTGELCGLWNSIEVAGLGIGAIFASRAALAIAPQIGLTTIFSLCSPVTVKFSEWQGGRIIKDIGNNGTFYYPKHDLLATAVFVQDMINMPDTAALERDRIMNLREQPRQVAMEHYPFRKGSTAIKISYDLRVQNADIHEFRNA
ncbi:hypothetical protein [Dinghuibacter silviterrae]|uniref:Uncharacterized protein n=1 Tax=Dinghuibacter silviterrae TaxID=1539049 RepID=A0A4R8DV15_9BACT|nr:hypothetical protein [Dinghuibacter silviterrae]TDX02252.1 hypothetical protein EDB95_3307 [Dinghuibacter silviterrae]